MYKFRKTVATTWIGTSVTTVETNLTWPSIYKPEGTTIMTDGLIRSRVTESDDDNHELGRWTFITLQGRDGRKLTLISVYKVCSTPIDHTKTNTILTQ